MAPPAYSRRELEKKSIADLLAIAKKQRIKLSGELDKGELINNILGEDGGSTSFSLDFKRRWENIGDRKFRGGTTDADDEGSLNLRSKQEKELKKEMDKIEGYMSGQFKDSDKSSLNLTRQRPAKKKPSPFMDGLEHLGVTKSKSDDLLHTRGRVSEASLDSGRSFRSPDEIEEDMAKEMSAMEALFDKILPKKKKIIRKKGDSKRPGIRGRKGLVNGMKGRDGLVNGRGKRGPGLVNGDGISFLIRSGGKSKKAKGLINGSGLVNGTGLTNGRGIINGTGLINGSGMTNGTGLTNGRGIINGKGILSRLGRGLTNGLKGEGGLINGSGLINGTGLTNGDGLLRHLYLRKIKGEGPATELRRSLRISMIKDRARREAVVASIIVLLLLIIPMIVYFMGVEESSFIKIDGEFDDWKGITSHFDPQDDTPNPSIDIVEYRMTDLGSDLSFYVKVQGNILSGVHLDESQQTTRGGGDIPYDTRGEDVLRIYLDVDGDPGTGYIFHEIGADYLVEISGHDSLANQARLKRFQMDPLTRGRSDFKDFVEDLPVSVAVTENTCEVQMWPSFGGNTGELEDMRAQMSITDYELNVDITSQVIGISDGELVISESSVAPEVTYDLQATTLLQRLDIQAEKDDCKVFSLGYEINGNVSKEDIYGVYLIEDTNSNDVYDPQDTILSTNNGSHNRFNLTEAMKVKEGQRRTLFLGANFTQQANNSHIGIRFKSHKVEHNSALTFIPEVMPGVKLVTTYLGVVPENISIDGAFADWNRIVPKYDSHNDLDELAMTTSAKNNVNLNEIRVATQDDDLYVNLNVRGDMLGGTTVPMDPLWRTYCQWEGDDTDGDGVYDPIDPNINDASDSDGDTIPDDYETVFLGTDANRTDTDNDSYTDNIDFDPLNGTIWSADQLPTRAAPQLFGQDKLYIFIDTDNSTTGFKPYWLPIGAEYMQVIEGKYGDITGSNLFGFAGTRSYTFNFTKVSKLPTAIDKHRLETCINISQLGVTGDVNIYVVAYNWNNKTKDEFDHPYTGDGTIYCTPSRSVQVLNVNTNITMDERYKYHPLELAEYLTGTNFNATTFEDMKEDAYKWSVEFRTSGSGVLYIGGYSFPMELMYAKLYFFNEETREFQEARVSVEDGYITADWSYKLGRVVFIPLNDTARVGLMFGNYDYGYLGNYSRHRTGGPEGLGTRGGLDPTKELYLHEQRNNYLLNTTVGSSYKTLRIRRDRSETWELDRPLAGDFNISGRIKTSLYLQPVGWVFWYPSVNVSITYGSSDTLVGFRVLESIQGTKWYDFIFDPLVEGIPAGETINLTIECIGLGWNSIWLSYDNETYDSSVEFHSPTYINVENVTAYNASGASSIIEPGSSLDIRALVTNPVGSYDISSANITIKAQGGSVLIPSQDMGIKSTDPNDPSFYKLFNRTIFFSTSLFTPGVYFAEVTALDPGGVTHSATLDLYVVADRGISLYPDITKYGTSNSSVSFQFILQNLAQGGETIELNISSSSQGWNSTIYNGTDRVAVDSDGDGDWDWIASSYDGDSDGIPEVWLPGVAKYNILLVKEIPIIQNPATDVTSLTATIEGSDGMGLNSSVANATLNGRIANVIKPMYLHDPAYMNYTIGGKLVNTTVSSGQTYSWTMETALAGDVDVLDYIPVYLYLNPTAFIGWKFPSVTVKLSYGSTTLGTDTATIYAMGWYEFTIAPVSKLPKGAVLKLDLSVNMLATSVTVSYNSSTYDSRIGIPTDTSLVIDSIDIYDDNASKRNIFMPGENYTVVARVSNPFGAQEITSVVLNIHSATRAGPLEFGPYDMTPSATDPANPPLWTDYSQTLQMNDTYLGVDYLASVAAVDSSDIEVMAMASVKKGKNGVDISPNNTATGTNGTNVTLAHTITNTGTDPSPDRYDITVSSVYGFNVTLYYDVNGNGVLDASDIWMGTDLGGDGTWNTLKLRDTGGLQPNRHGLCERDSSQQERQGHGHRK